MRKGLTELVFILDKSGSMMGLERDTIGGYNSMIKKQREEAGEVLVSTVLFSHEMEVLHDRVPLDRIADMTERDYQPSGMTSLLDAIGGAIHHIGNIHKYARPEDVPEKTLFIITTDGQENSSKRYSYRKVQQMVKHEKEKYGWEFLFLGANIDAIDVARHFGIDADRAVDYCCDEEGTALNYEILNATVASYRKGAPIKADWKEKIEEDFKKRGRRR